MRQTAQDEAGSDAATRLGRVRGGIARVLREKPTSEHVLLVLFLVLGVLMYLGAADYSEEARLFPQILSAIVVLLSVALLARNYLPGPIRSFVAEPYQLGGDTDPSEEYGLDTDETDESDRDSTDDDGSNSSEKRSDELTGAYVYDVDDWVGPAVVASLSVGYLALAMVIGLIYSTPAFIATYLLWSGRPYPDGLGPKLRTGVEIAVLSALGFAIALGFEWLTPRSITGGVWTGWEVVLPLGVV